jgi:integrase
MKALRQAVGAYLALRRRLGYQLRDTARYLAGFLVLLTRRPCLRITTALALEFATADAKLSASARAARYSAVRGFAQYWQAFDPASEVPPPGLVRKPRHRAPPWSCSDAALAAVLESFPATASRLHGWTWPTVLGLLAASGLRISEAIHLERGDVDWATGTLTIRHTKFGKSRQVVLHPSTQRVLAAYDRRRQRFFARWPQRLPQNFFLSEHGTPLFATVVRRVWRARCRAVGLLKADGQPPRLHDLRHRFAVETLRRWYQDGGPVEPRLPALATALGHGGVAATYWYLHSTPELRVAASQRLAAHWKGGDHASCR